MEPVQYAAGVDSDANRLLRWVKAEVLRKSRDAMCVEFDWLRL